MIAVSPIMRYSGGEKSEREILVVSVTSASLSVKVEL